MPRSPKIDLCMWPSYGTAPSAGAALRTETRYTPAPGSATWIGKFAASDTVVRAALDQVLAVVSAFGPVHVLPEKTRIALHVRMSFAAFIPRRHWLSGHLVMARHADSLRFLKVEELSPRNVVHTFRLNSPGDVDAEFTGWLGEAYLVGCPQHLGRHT